MATKHATRTAALRATAPTSQKSASTSSTAKGENAVSACDGFAGALAPLAMPFFTSDWWPLAAEHLNALKTKTDGAFKTAIASIELRIAGYAAAHSALADALRPSLRGLFLGNPMEPRGQRDRRVLYRSFSRPFLLDPLSRLSSMTGNDDRTGVVRVGGGWKLPLDPFPQEKSAKLAAVQRELVDIRFFLPRGETCSVDDLRDGHIAATQAYYFRALQCSVWAEIGAIEYWLHCRQRGRDVSLHTWGCLYRRCQNSEQWNMSRFWEQRVTEVKFGSRKQRDARLDKIKADKHPDFDADEFIAKTEKAMAAGIKDDHGNLLTPGMHGYKVWLYEVGPYRHFLDQKAWLAAFEKYVMELPKKSKKERIRRT